MNNLTFNNEDFVLLKQEMEKAISLMEQGIVVSEESFGSFFKKVLTGVVDRIFIHINNVFKNTFSLFNVKGIFDTIVMTSPIDDFLTRNKSKSIIFFNEKYYRDYVRIIAPKPRGMLSTYKDILENHKQLVKSLNMIPFIKATNNDLGVILGLITDSKTTADNFELQLKDIVKNSTVNEKTLLSLAKEHDQSFSGNSEKAINAPFGDEFKNVNDVKFCCEESVNIFSYLKKTKEVYNEYSSQSMLIRKVIDAIEKHEDLLKKNCFTLLIHYFQYVATCYQLFGTLSVSQLAIENNLIIIMNDMLKISLNR